MKVLLVNKFWYLRGGAERVVFATKQMLEDSGHQVEIFGMNHPRNELSNRYFIDFVDYQSIKGIKRARAALKSIYNRQARDNFKKLIEEFQPDIVHFHNIYHQLSFSLFDVIKEKKIPAVMTLHDYQLICPNYNLYHHGRIDEESCLGSYYKCILNNCLENLGESIFAAIGAYFTEWKGYREVIGKYISPSEFLKNKFINYGFSAGQITVIPNPIDLALYDRAKVDGEYVGFFGRLSREKGLEVLLQAAKNTPEILYKIVGEGPMEKDLRFKIADFRLKNVSVEGFQTGKKLAQSIDGARIIVVPSVWYENCPLSILEAKAMGKVALGSDIGGMSELLPRELLFKAGDAKELSEKISRWFQAPFTQRKKIGLDLRETVAEQNDPKKYLRSLLVVYRRLIKV
ncbi:MAG: glycosyltransferase [Patescibacteria group bacterium]